MAESIEQQKESKRRRFTAREKMMILKAHLVDKKPVSDVCDEHQINPTLFYRWQQGLFERGVTAFESEGEKPSARLTQQVRELEQKLTRKNEVLSELMEEHVALKKSLGGK